MGIPSGGEKEHVQGNQEPVTATPGRQTAAGPEKPGASSDTLVARIETLEIALAKQLMDSEELKTSLTASSKTIDGLKAHIAHMTTQSGLLQTQLDEEASSRANVQNKFDAAIKSAVASAMETQDSARIVLGARILELEDSLTRRREARETEVSLPQARANDTMDAISERIERLELDQRETCSSGKFASERLDEHQTRDKAGDESIRVLTAQYRKMKDSVKNLDTLDQNRDKQADILMKHSEETRKRSLETKQQADELRQLYETNHGHVMTTFEEHENQMRLLEDAVMNCEMHLKIRPRPKTTVYHPVASGPTFAQRLAGTLSPAGRLSLTPSETAKRYRPASTDPYPGPSSQLYES